MGKKSSNVFGAILLIGIGVLFLLDNFGIISVNIWSLMGRFWPVFIIAAGLDMLLGRRARGGNWIGLIIAILVVGLGIFWLLPNFLSSSGPAETTTIDQPLDGADQAEITLNMGIGELLVDAAPETSRLAKGTISLLAGQKLISNFSIQNDTAYYQLDSEGGSFGFPWFGITNQDNLRWDLQLNKDTPLELKVDTGAGRSELDLGGLQVTNLKIDIGVGETLVTLPSEGVVDADIDGGIGELTILIPSTLAAQIDLSNGIGQIDVVGDFQQDDDKYISPNFDNAEHRVTLNVDSGIGAIHIRQMQSE